VVCGSAGTPRTPRQGQGQGQGTPRGYSSHHNDAHVADAPRNDSFLSKSPSKHRLPGKEHGDMDVHSRMESASQASGDMTELHSTGGSYTELFNRKGDAYENARRSMHLEKASLQAHASQLHPSGGRHSSPARAGESSSRRELTPASRVDAFSDASVDSQTQTETFRSISVRKSNSSCQTVAVVKDEASVRQNKDEYASLNTKVEFLHRLLQGDLMSTRHAFVCTSCLCAHALSLMMMLSFICICICIFFFCHSLYAFKFSPTACPLTHVTAPCPKELCMLLSLASVVLTNHALHHFFYLTEKEVQLVAVNVELADSQRKLARTSSTCSDISNVLQAQESNLENYVAACEVCVCMCVRVVARIRYLLCMFVTTNLSSGVRMHACKCVYVTRLVP
jgi:hypothetical protein